MNIKAHSRIEIFIKRTVPSWSEAFIFAVIFSSVTAVLYLIFNINPTEFAYTPNLSLDAPSYERAAQQMLEQNSWFFAPETYHSSAQQVWVANIYRVFSDAPGIIKVFNFAAYFFSILLIYFCGMKLRLPRRRSLFAAALLASCGLLQAYCGTMQYEPVAMALLLICALLYLNQKNFILGALCGILLYFRLHYLAVLLPFVYGLWRAKVRFSLVQFFTGLASIVAPLNIAYAVHFQSLSAFQSFPPEHYKKWLCLGAEGWNFPYFEWTPDSLCGFDFILQAPGAYLELLGKRFLYWTGYLQDISWAPPIPLLTNFNNAQYIAHILITTIIILTYVHAIKKSWQQKDHQMQNLILIPVLSFTPFLIAGAAIRFLIPILPFVWLSISKYTFKKSNPTHP